MVFGVENDPFDNSLFRDDTFEKLDRVLRQNDLPSQILERQAKLYDAVESQADATSQVLEAADQIDLDRTIPTVFQTASAVDNAFTAISKLENAVGLHQSICPPTIFQVLEDIQSAMDHLELLLLDNERLWRAMERQLSPKFAQMEVEAYAPIVAYTLSELAADVWNSLTAQERGILIGILMLTFYTYRIVFSDYTINDFLMTIPDKLLWHQLLKQIWGE